MNNIPSAVPQYFVYSKKQSLIAKIKTKGWNEQERQYLFSGLYGNKAVTKNTIGQFKTFDRQLRRGKYAPLI